MARLTARRDDRRRDDRGSALILTLMVLALVTGLSTTVAVVTINNLQSSMSAQQAGAALNAADAGVAQAMSYLRSSGVRDLRCSPSCTSNAWGSETTPTSVSLPGIAGRSYKVWIEKVSPYPANDPGLYRIHSTGSAGGSAARTVSADVRVTTTNVPKGVFARTISGGGSAAVARESIFSTGCVYDRSKITMVPGQLDVAYGIPIAVHSSQVITESNGTGQFCPTTNKPIHDPSKTGAARYCNTAYPYDQDKYGGSLSGGCASAPTTYPNYYGSRDLDGDTTTDVNGSFLKDDLALFRLFNINAPALTPAQIDQLRSVAQSQGNYWTGATGWSSPDESNAVMFFDLQGAQAGGIVDLNDITGFGRDPDVADADAACATRSLVIVIEGGNAKLNSNQKLVASLFLTAAAPNGQVLKANGTSRFIGTIYADNVNLVGNTELSLDTCFMANSSPALLDLHLENYREEDRSLS